MEELSNGRGGDESFGPKPKRLAKWRILWSSAEKYVPLSSLFASFDSLYLKGGAQNGELHQCALCMDGANSMEFAGLFVPYRSLKGPCVQPSISFSHRVTGQPAISPGVLTNIFFDVVHTCDTPILDLQYFTLRPFEASSKILNGNLMSSPKCPTIRDGEIELGGYHDWMPRRRRVCKPCYYAKTHLAYAKWYRVGRFAVTHGVTAVVEAD